MKVMKQVSIPAHMETRVDFYKCELCDAKTEDESNWGEHQYDVKSVTVEYESGSNYPGDYSSDTIALDICPKCFKEKLIPWFVAQGGQPRKSER